MLQSSEVPGPTRPVVSINDKKNGSLMLKVPLVYGPSESAELLALAEQIGRIGVIDWQVETGKVHLSATALSMYGLQDFDGLYDTWRSTVHHDDQARLRKVVAAALADNTHEFELDFRIVRRNDKQLRWILARRLVFRDGTGKPIRVVGVSVDVTERKQAEAALHEQNATLARLVEETAVELRAKETLIQTFFDHSSECYAVLVEVEFRPIPVR